MHDWIKEFAIKERLPESYTTSVRFHLRDLAKRIITLQQQKGRPILVGINGPQGSGKSTACVFLKALLEYEQRLIVNTVSLDDFYLTKEERMNLAAEVHPLLSYRGVPGTHDIELLTKVISFLKGATNERSIKMPIFDKLSDNRSPECQLLSQSADVTILEGWCVGSLHQEDISIPVNEIEKHEDPNLIWRNFVNKKLKGQYRDLFNDIDYLISFSIPCMDLVYKFKKKQEYKLAEMQQRHNDLTNETELKRFISLYQRITEANIESMPTIADAIVAVDSSHQITGVNYN